MRSAWRFYTLLIQQHTAAALSRKPFCRPTQTFTQSSAHGRALNLGFIILPFSPCCFLLRRLLGLLTDHIQAWSCGGRASRGYKLRSIGSEDWCLWCRYGLATDDSELQQLLVAALLQHLCGVVANAIYADNPVASKNCFLRGGTANALAVPSLHGSFWPHSFHSQSLVLLMMRDIQSKITAISLPQGEAEDPLALTRWRKRSHEGHWHGRRGSLRAESLCQR